MLDPQAQDEAIAILRSEAEFAVPVARVFRSLEAALGPQPGGADTLCERLREHRDLFVVFEPRRPPWGTGGLVHPEIDDEVTAVLRSAGLEPGPRVLLRRAAPDDDAPPHERLLQQIAASLVDLLDHTSGDADIEGEVLEAMDEATRMRKALVAQKR